MINELVQYLYNSKFINRIIRTLPSALNDELKDCHTILDIGCGPKSPVRFQTERGKQTFGIDLYAPYLQKARENYTHLDFFLGGLDEFIRRHNNRRFDAVVLIDVIEHLGYDEARKLLIQAESIALKKVIVNTPNGFVEQKMLDNNPFQVHLSGWTVDDLKSLGFKCKGLAGIKYLRTEVESDEMGDDILVSIKFRPKFFFFIISAVSQIFLYNLPNLTFSIFAVKRKHEPKQ